MAIDFPPAIFVQPLTWIHDTACFRAQRENAPEDGIPLTAAQDLIGAETSQQLCWPSPLQILIDFLHRSALLVDLTNPIASLGTSLRPTAMLQKRASLGSFAKGRRERP